MTSETYYLINYSNGFEQRAATLPAAYTLCREEWPGMVAIHEVGQADWSESDESIEGEDQSYRILVWEDETSSIDDSGARAVASVSRMYESEVRV